jgi:hypothetical protein
MISILWLGRREIGDEQENALKSLLEVDEYEISSNMIVWRVSIDESSDNEVNTDTWLDLMERYDVVCGVFPPSALVALWTAKGIVDDSGRACRGDFRVFTPISMVCSSFGQKEFRFLRWQEL